MPDYPPIPIPFKQRWREFRMRILPVLIFLVAVGAIIRLWEQQAVPGSMVGEVYAPFSSMVAPRAGWIEGAPLELLKEVRAGEEIARIRTMPEEQAKLALAVLQEEIKMIRLGVGDPVLDQQRNMLSWQGLRRDWFICRSELAVLDIQVRQAESNYLRVKNLVESGAESVFMLEQAQSLFDSMVSEKAEKKILCETLEAAVNSARVSEGETDPDLGAGIVASLDWKEAELRHLEAELSSVPIIAPYDGRITRIFHHAGDFVNIGEPIFEFRSTEAQGIIAYLKQPTASIPNIGMKVEIAPRGAPRGAAMRARIVGIGPQFEALQPAFVRPAPYTIEERGLPVQISLPGRHALLPGEIVEIRLPRTGG